MSDWHSAMRGLSARGPICWAVQLRGWWDSSVWEILDVVLRPHNVHILSKHLHLQNLCWVMGPSGCFSSRLFYPHSPYVWRKVVFFSTSNEGLTDRPMLNHTLPRYLPMSLWPLSRINIKPLPQDTLERAIYSFPQSTVLDFPRYPLTVEAKGSVIMGTFCEMSLRCWLKKFSLFSGFIQHLYWRHECVHHHLSKTFT